VIEGEGWCVGGGWHYRRRQDEVKTNDWVLMRAAKNMQSDARKAHMKSFLFGIPVVVV
jgi:hypothetical protein